MMHLFEHVEQSYGFKILQSKQLSGGDISQVYHLQTAEDDFVIKINAADKKEIFLSEKLGLETIAATDIFRLPKVYGIHEFEKFSYILLEFIPTGQPKESSFYQFGEKLAQMHQVYSDKFGFEKNNFIGSLPQSNVKHTSWAIFYWEERIKPQYDLALKQQLIDPKAIPQKDVFIEIIQNEFYWSQPALLHGDLWNGNYMIDDTGNAVLIDPAVYYGHPMIDMGMTQLFGGFPEDFYTAYKSSSNHIKNWDNLIELTQWYYLLVHLNLFGKSYLSAVNRIKNKYFHG